MRAAVTDPVNRPCKRQNRQRCTSCGQIFGDEAMAAQRAADIRHGHILDLRRQSKKIGANNMRCAAKLREIAIFEKQAALVPEIANLDVPPVR